MIIDCKTGNSSSIVEFHKRKSMQSGVPCIFPFTRKGKTYYSCTYDISHYFDYKPWCATKVDEYGELISKNKDGSRNYGICDPDENPLECPIPPRRKF